MSLNLKLHSSESVRPCVFRNLLKTSPHIVQNMNKRFVLNNISLFYDMEFMNEVAEIN